MAGPGGGGSWKVAYADFVTAMMAFFLVMWITAQDAKIKQAIARYFNNPMNLDNPGTSKKPDVTGAYFPVASGGSVPKVQSTAMGKGRQAHSQPGAPSSATKLVADWICADEKRFALWRGRAQQWRNWASATRDLRPPSPPPLEFAARQLAIQLRSELAADMPEQLGGIHQDLLFHVLGDVNWFELAEDLLAE